MVYYSHWSENISWLQGYNTGYRYKGLSLLEPGTGTPTINRKDVAGQSSTGMATKMLQVYILYKFKDVVAP